MTSLGFVSSQSDHSLFILHTLISTTIVLVYVDDILVTGSDSQVVTRLIAALNSEFSLKDLETVNYFLGIEVTYIVDGIHICQAKYARDLLIKAQMAGTKPSPTPMTSGLRLSAHQGDPMVDVQM
uniref:Reverse transcriptase Ty1/copia-type domain-containing protein n=1 Tax=Cannabis sativa TaxID=3483 RepID=A0A803QBT0_CANSA